MNFQPTEAQKRAIYFYECVTLANVDDDLKDTTLQEWPELLTRSQVAKILGVTAKWVSTLSKRGHLQKHRDGRQVYWRLGDVQAYAQERAVPRPRNELGQFV